MILSQHNYKIQCNHCICSNYLKAIFMNRKQHVCWIYACFSWKKQSVNDTNTRYVCELCAACIQEVDADFHTSAAIATLNCPATASASIGTSAIDINAAPRTNPDVSQAAIISKRNQCLNVRLSSIDPIEAVEGLDLILTWEETLMSFSLDIPFDTARLLACWRAGPLCEVFLL